MFKYYLKKVCGNKAFLFWTLMFPLCLMMCFKIAFSNIYNEENSFEPVPVVYVNTSEENIEDNVSGLVEQYGLGELYKSLGFDQFMEAVANGDEEFLENFSVDENEFAKQIEMAMPQLSQVNPDASMFDGIKELMYINSFEKAIKELAEEGDEQCFVLTEVSSVSEAEKLLDSGEQHVAFIVEDGELRTELTAGYSDTDTIVVNSFLSAFDSMYSVMTEDFDQMDLTDFQSADAMDRFRGESIKDEVYVEAKKNVFEETPNPYNWYYYATFVMGVMFNIIAGIGIVADIQADITKSALRVSVSSTSKTKIFGAVFASRFVVVFVCECIQLLIINYVYKIPVGNRIPQLMLFVVLSIIFTLSLGELLGLLLKGDVSKRENIANALLMTSVFLSGEMIATLPGVIELHCPIINKINPATVLNFSFYNLVYYEDLTGFYMNLVKIAVASVVLMVASISILRRQKYASI